MMAILYLFLVISAFSQQFEFRLEGSFPTRAGVDPTNPAMVNYQIDWNETENEIQGLYRDNYFTGEGPRSIMGTTGTKGRRFNLTLPAPSKGVRQLTFSTDQAGVLSGTIAMKTITKDRIGATIDDHAGFSLMSIQTTTGMGTGGPTTENDSCIIGFGTLTKLCGLYNGMMNELFDPRNLCDISTRNPRLEFAQDTTFRMLLNYAPGAANLPMHFIGTVPPSPTTNTINITHTECLPMPGTRFVPGNCKTVGLSGSFQIQPGTTTFTGTYVIRDDVNGDSCSYTLNFSREVAY